MSDIPMPMERSMLNQEIVGRWRGAWQLYNQGADGQTNILGITRIFLKSIFKPDSFPTVDQFPPQVDRTLLQRLTGFSPFASVKPTEAVLQEAERSMVEKVLDVDPPLVPGAMATIDHLAKTNNFTIWTVGDTLESSHHLPEELVGRKDTLPGTGHQFWKLWKLGLTRQSDIHIAVSDNKQERILNSIREQEKLGLQRFVIMDDDFGNLERAKQLIDQDNLDRELQGATPVSYDLVLVNQGRKRKVPPPEITTKGSLGTYSVIDRFAEAVGRVDEIKKTSHQDRLGIFCDFDGVVTDNVAMRQEWDKIAENVVEEVVERSRLKNPQKEIAAGKITSEDIRLAKSQPYIEACRQKGLRIGVLNGAFDILHPGHLEALKEARDACDVLIVMLNSDRSIREYKGVKDGIRRPLTNEAQRAAVLLGLEHVDRVVLFDEQNPSNLIKEIKPNVYISSDEYKDKPLPEFEAAKQVGADVIFTSPRIGVSTSSIVSAIRNNTLQSATGVEAVRLSPVAV